VRCRDTSVSVPCRWLTALEGFVLHPQLPLYRPQALRHRAAFAAQIGLLSTGTSPCSHGFPCERRIFSTYTPSLIFLRLPDSQIHEFEVEKRDGLLKCKMRRTQQAACDKHKRKKQTEGWMKRRGC
jgi:hypothetical protein